MAKSGVLYLFHLEQRNPSPLDHQARDLLTTTGAGTRAHKKDGIWASRALIYRFEDAGAGSSTYDLIRTCLLSAGRMHVPRDMDDTHARTNVTSVCVWCGGRSTNSCKREATSTASRKLKKARHPLPMKPTSMQSISPGSH